MKVKTYLRNITTDIDFMVHLPVNNLSDVLDKNCEYIITECEVLNPDEFDSIWRLNDFLEGCRQNGITKDELEILSATYLYNEIVKMITDGTFAIIDFAAETADWYCGNGGSFWNADDLGMCVFDSGFYNPFDFEMTDDIHDWIDWSSVWTNAETEGWRKVKVNENGYLVHR